MGWLGYEYKELLSDDFLESKALPYGGKISDIEVVSVGDIRNPNEDHHKQVYGVLENGGKKIGVCSFVRFEENHVFVKTLNEGMGPSLVAASPELISKLSDTDSQFAKDWRKDCLEYFDESQRKEIKANTSTKLLSDIELDTVNKRIRGEKIQMPVEYEFFDALSFDNPNWKKDPFDGWSGFSIKNGEKNFDSIVTNQTGLWYYVQTDDIGVTKAEKVSEKEVALEILESRNGKDLEGHEKLLFKNKSPMNYKAKVEMSI